MQPTASSAAAAASSAAAAHHRPGSAPGAERYRYGAATSLSNGMTLGGQHAVNNGRAASSSQHQQQGRDGAARGGYGTSSTAPKSSWDPMLGTSSVSSAAHGRPRTATGAGGGRPSTAGAHVVPPRSAQVIAAYAAAGAAPVGARHWPTFLADPTSSPSPNQRTVADAVTAFSPLRAAGGVTAQPRASGAAAAAARRPQSAAPAAARHVPQRPGTASYHSRRW